MFIIGETIERKMKIPLLIVKLKLLAKTAGLVQTKKKVNKILKQQANISEQIAELLLANRKREKYNTQLNVDNWLKQIKERFKSSK